MLEVLMHDFFGGGTSGFWGGQVVLVIHLSVGQVDFLTKFEPCIVSSFILAVVFVVFIVVTHEANHYVFTPGGLSDSDQKWS